MEVAWLEPIDGDWDWDSEDLTPLSGEDLWQAVVGPKPVAQSRKQRRNPRKTRSRRDRTAREDIVSVPNLAALLAAVGLQGTEPSPPQAALPSKKPVTGRRSANCTTLAAEPPPHAEGGVQQHAHGGMQQHALAQGRALPPLHTQMGAHPLTLLPHAPGGAQPLRLPHTSGGAQPPPLPHTSGVAQLPQLPHVHRGTQPVYTPALREGLFLRPRRR